MRDFELIDQLGGGCRVQGLSPPPAFNHVCPEQVEHGFLSGLRNARMGDDKSNSTPHVVKSKQLAITVPTQHELTVRIANHGLSAKVTNHSPPLLAETEC
jgi:hypothetical protein